MIERETRVVYINCTCRRCQNSSAQKCKTNSRRFNFVAGVAEFPNAPDRTAKLPY